MRPGSCSPATVPCPPGRRQQCPTSARGWRPKFNQQRDDMAGPLVHARSMLKALAVFRDAIPAVGCVAVVALTAGPSQPATAHTSDPTRDRPPQSDCLTAADDPAVTERLPLATFTALDVTVPVD